MKHRGYTGKHPSGWRTAFWVAVAAWVLLIVWILTQPVQAVLL